MKILCLSIDENITKQVEDEGRSQHWLVECVSKREDARTAILESNPDMLLIDVQTLDDLDWWHEQGLLEDRAALLINAELSEEFVFKAFDCGVDGLIPKSLFSRRFLTARVNAFLRRRPSGDNRRVVSRLGMIIDSQRYQAEFRGTAITLTPTEFKILREIAIEDTSPVSRSRIQSQVFGADATGKRSLDVHVCALRKKLRPLGFDLSSARRVGYQLNPCAQ